MNTYLNPINKDWPEILSRPSQANIDLEKVVRPILEAVRRQGDEALREYTQLLDKVVLEEPYLKVPDLKEASALIDDNLRNAINQAAANIRKYHATQVLPKTEVETMKGVRCWWETRAIEKVGLYIPGGTAPLISTILMLGIPAQLAGCEELVLVSPPNQEGKVHPAMIYAASLLQIPRIYLAGGAQAVAALAFGTESIPKVDKIFGPGNQYVTLAKQLVAQEGVAIDMPAGPSEVLVLADRTANPEFVAADLLSQAEHGVDSQAVLVALDQEVLEASVAAVNRMCDQIPRGDMARKALENSPAILLDDLERAIELINVYAPEHLILNVKNAAGMTDQIKNAGSVFVGAYSPESVGDYASGTNHTLPTAGFAKAYSGLGVKDFQKTISFQELSEEGLINIADTVMRLAEAERLEAHKLAVEVRLQELKAD